MMRLSIACFTCSGICFIPVIILITALAALTPIYEPIVRIPLDSVTGAPAQSLMWINISTTVAQRLENDNRYEFEFAPDKDGGVFWWNGTTENDQVPIGYTNALPSVIPAHGAADLKAEVHVQLPTMYIPEIMLGGGVVNVTSSLYQKMHGKLSVLGFMLGESKPLIAWCAYQVILPAMQSGRSVCAPTLAELPEIPPYTDTSKNPPSKVLMPRKDRENAENMRSRMVWMPLVLCFFVMSLSIFFGVYYILKAKGRISW